MMTRNHQVGPDHPTSLRSPHRPPRRNRLWFDCVRVGDSADRGDSGVQDVPGPLAAGPLARLWTAIVAVAVLTAVAGCTGSTASTAEDDGRLEHHVPAHKPATFAAAVDQIQARCESLATGAADSPSPQNWSELLDIVRWLPELAGDSDLQRADWEVVQRVSRQLEAILQPQASAARLSPETLEQARKLLAELAPLMARADRLQQQVSR